MIIFSQFGSLKCQHLVELYFLFLPFLGLLSLCDCGRLSETKLLGFTSAWSPSHPVHQYNYSARDAQFNIQLIFFAGKISGYFSFSLWEIIHLMGTLIIQSSHFLFLDRPFDALFTSSILLQIFAYLSSVISVFSSSSVASVLYFYFYIQSL